jgi:hypothetical protein
MRRLIALTLAIACVSAAPARAGGISLGAFGGAGYPVLQNDTGSGTLYGVRAPVSVVPFLTVEPYWESSRFGDKQLAFEGLSYTRKGFEETAYGANVLLAAGGPLSFYPLAGIGQATLKSGGASQAYTMYNVGFGLGVHVVPKLTFHVRGELRAVAVKATTRTFGGVTISDGNTTRKFASATAGVTYSLFGLP